MHRIKRLPIVEDERLVGIVSRRDILRVIAEATSTVLPRGDEAIRLAVRTRLRSGLVSRLKRCRYPSGTDGSRLTARWSRLKRRAIKVLVEGHGGIAGYKDRLLVSPVHNQDRRHGRIGGPLSRRMARSLLDRQGRASYLSPSLTCTLRLAPGD